MKKDKTNKKKATAMERKQMNGSSKMDTPTRWK